MHLIEQESVNVYHRNFEELQQISDLNGCDAGGGSDDTGNDFVPDFR